MKFDDIRSVAHNFAESFGSGASLLFNHGFYPYEDAASSPDGCLEIDFLAGAVISGNPSPDLVERVALSPGLLADLCRRHGGSVEAFAYFRTRYSTTLTGRQFEVTVANCRGRRKSDRYNGISGSRLEQGKHPPVSSA